MILLFTSFTSFLIAPTSDEVVQQQGSHIGMILFLIQVYGPVSSGVE